MGYAVLYIPIATIISAISILYGHLNQIDRKNDYYYLSLGLILPDGKYHHETILDAELVFESEHVLQVLLFDAMVIQGKNICNKPYNGRLGVCFCNAVPSA
jgi:hypothetical protein